eukprot:gene5266-1531_t
MAVEGENIEGTVRIRAEQEVWEKLLTRGRAARVNPDPHGWLGAKAHPDLDAAGKIIEPDCRLVTTLLPGLKVTEAKLLSAQRNSKQGIAGKTVRTRVLRICTAGTSILGAAYGLQVAKVLPRGTLAVVEGFPGNSIRSAGVPQASGKVED